MSIKMSDQQKNNHKESAALDGINKKLFPNRHCFSLSSLDISVYPRHTKV